jgi:hypothetical protein
MNEIKVLQVGMGVMGFKVTKFLLERKNFKIIGAVDKDPAKISKSLNSFLNDSQIKETGIKISGSVEEAIKGSKPDIAILTTISSVNAIVPQIEEIVRFKIPIVSTCEELSYPWGDYREAAERIDKAAKANNVAVLATGVNPGFMMDAFPIFLTSACQKVNKIKISRIQNARFRRVPFQKKIGTGLTLEKFEEKKKEGTIRHVGLSESMNMISAALNWKLDKTVDIISPVISTDEIVLENFKIKIGEVAGVQQIGIGYIGDEEKIVLLFRAAIDEKEPVDKIEISGIPDIVSSIPGGVNGDIATCAISLNAIKQVMGAAPGLKTMIDIPPVSYFE